MVKTFCLPIERRMAVEIMFCMTTGKPIVRLDIMGFNGAYCFRAFVKYDHNVEKLYYFDSAGAWIELPLVDSTTLLQEPWFFMKLVVDWDKKEYIRFIFCSTEYDLSGIGMRSTVDITKKRMNNMFYNIAGTNAVSTVYFDNFILTQNEP